MRMLRVSIILRICIILCIGFFVFLKWYPRKQKDATYRMESNIKESQMVSEKTNKLWTPKKNHPIPSLERRPSNDASVKQKKVISKHQNGSKTRDRMEDRVRIHVVEEHHEVLPYWFLAVKDGILPEKGNTLLHIDGHSDDAPPDMDYNYPLYRRPHNSTELRLMLQSNDMFIKAAIMAGMFERFIWVWPEWDKANHDESHLKVTVEYGKMVTTENKRQVTYYCACLSDKEESKCVIYNRTAYEENINATELSLLPRHRCDMRGSYQYEEVNENIAKTLIKKSWIKKQESLVIDIDEDFFGCESSGSALVKAGVEWKRIKRINMILDDMICPRKTIHEQPANVFIMSVVHQVLKLCKLKGVCSLSKDEIRNISSSAATDGIQNKKPFLCTHHSKLLLNYAKLLTAKLSKMTRQQLVILSKLGFCMFTTPKSLFFSMNKRPGIGEFHVCSGMNPPNDPVVLYHSPSKAEVKSRVQLLYDMIGRGNYPKPTLVTVCRSVRDGYTPRKHFTHIEYGILNATTTKIGTDQYMIYYDRDLLGGKQGLPATLTTL